MNAQLRISIAAVIGVALAGSACSSDDGPVPGSESAAVGEQATVPLIVDYSPTLSDVPALLYLAEHPGVDLLAVTLAGTGESDCEPGVRNTLSLLRLAGHDDVPVACGPTEPLVGDRDWPAEFTAASRTIEGVYLPGLAGEIDTGDAVGVIIDALDAADDPVVVVTLGPLTNLAVVFDTRPDLVAAVERVVVMGGAVDVAGNVLDAPDHPWAGVPGAGDAEWNLFIDPEAARRVLASGVDLLLVPLDATNSVPGNRGLHERLERSPGLEPGGEAVGQLYAANLQLISSAGWYFWDELAAVAATDPWVVATEDRRIVIDDAGATITDPNGVAVDVATAADPVRFADLFVEVLSGGREVPPRPLGPAEVGYLDAVTVHGDELAVSLDSAFSKLFSLEELPTVAESDVSPAAAVETIFSAYETFAAALGAIDAPDAFAPEHETLVQSLELFIALEGELVGGVTAILEVDPDQSVDAFFVSFDELVADVDVLGPLAVVARSCDAIGVEAALRGIAFTDACAAIGGG